MTKVTRFSCCHQHFVPKGLSAPAPRLYICIKSWKKNVENQTSKRLANDRNDKRFLLTSKFCPLGLSALICGYIHLLNHEKMCMESEVEEILLQQMTIVMRPSCWHKTFGPNGLSAPAQGLCLNFFSSITADFNIFSALRWAIQDQWSSGFSIPQELHQPNDFECFKNETLCQDQPNCCCIQMWKSVSECGNRILHAFSMKNNPDLSFNK